MSREDQYKDEAIRLLNLNPLDVCYRVAERLKACGWKLDHFDCKVEVFDAIRWYVKVHIKTGVTKKNADEKWAELNALFDEMGMEANLVIYGLHSETDVRSHRKYDRFSIDGRRYLIGHWYDFHVEFKPKESLAVSVLTEESA